MRPALTQQSLDGLQEVQALEHVAVHWVTAMQRFDLGDLSCNVAMAETGATCPGRPEATKIENSF